MTEVGLTSLEELRVWTRSASGTANDALLTRLGIAASQAVLGVCGITVPASAQTYTDEEYDGTGMPWLKLLRAPISSVTTVKIEGDTVDTSTYRVDEEIGLLLRVGTDTASGGDLPTAVWPEGLLNIKVTYTTPAYSGLSLDQRKVLEQAALLWVGSWWSGRGRDPWLTSERVGDYSYQRGVVGEFSQSVIPPEIVALLRPFKKMVVA